MLPNERTTRDEIAAAPGEVEGLVVAPNRGTTRDLVDLLRSEGINVQVVHSADQGFEEALLHLPNVVLIDEGISRAGGVDLCERLKANTRTHFLPVIIFSHGKDNDLLRLDALAAGADALFSPTTSKDERRARLWALLRSQAIFRNLESKRQAQNSKIGHKRRWVRGLVHDIQNSLGAIHANFEFLSQLSEPRDPGKRSEMDECVQETRATFRAMVRDLRTVIEFERMEAGDVDFRQEAVLLSDVAREASAALQLFAADAGKQVIVETTHDSLPVRGDPQYLKDAVVGLTAFLLRQPENQKCFIQASAHDGFSRLRMCGNRFSLPLASREHLFDPYPPRAPDKSSRVAQRVGLALANAIVTAQQGTIRIEDSPSGSTAFLIEIPSLWTAEDAEPSE